MKRPEFTQEQEWWISAEIDHWYYEWKSKIGGESPHKLWIAKEQLKQRLGGEEIDRSIEFMVQGGNL